MRKIFLLNVVLASVFSNLSQAQAPRFQWVTRAGGLLFDQGSSVAIDDLDNVLVAGHFFDTASFDGTTLTSTGEGDIVVAKYDPAGRLIWVRQIGGTNFDFGQGLATDSEGNVIVTGRITGPATVGGVTLPGFGGTDIYLVKFDRDGALVWARQAGGTSNEGGWAVATDSANNILLTGFINIATADFGGKILTSTGRTDVFLAKYDPAGRVLWAKRAGGSGFDNGWSVATDGDDNIFVTGSFSNTATFDDAGLTSSGNSDIFIAAYEPEGNLGWVRQAGGSELDQPWDIAIDSDGNAFVTGLFSGSAKFTDVELVSPGLRDLFLAKYDRGGNFFWVRQGGASARAEGQGISTDRDGNCIVSGLFQSTAAIGDTMLSVAGDSVDILVAKYDTDGNFTWAKRAGGPDHDLGHGNAIDSQGDILVAGWFRESAGFGDFTLSSAGEADMFLAKISEFNVLAQVNCAPNLPEGCPVTIAITIDVSGASPPERLGSFTGTLTWDASLRFTGHSGLLAGFTGLVNDTDATSGLLRFNGANTSGTAGRTEVLRVDFEVVGASGASGGIEPTFSAMAAAGAFRDLLPELTVEGCDFTITEAGLLGDVNGDGLVNSTDALIILSFDVGFEIPEEILARITSGIGDVNGDDLTNSTDALIMLSFDVGLEVPFAVSEKFCP